MYRLINFLTGNYYCITIGLQKTIQRNLKRLTDYKKTKMKIKNKNYASEMKLNPSFLEQT